MLINFSQHLINPIDGMIIYENDSKEKVSTLGSICTTSLFSQVQGDENLDGKKKFEFYDLAMKVKEGEVDLKAEEVALLKERVGKVFTPLMVGIVYNILDK